MGCLLLLIGFKVNGIGVGIYGNLMPGIGIGFSVRSHQRDMVLQGVIAGMSAGKGRGAIMLVGRLPITIDRGGRGYIYTQHIGPGIWLLLVTGGVGFGMSGFYEVEFLPWGREFPLAFGIGGGIVFSLVPIVRADFLIPFNIHFYLQ
jgi:hypothetical protein